MGKKRSSLDYRLVELLLDLKTASYINKICNNSYVVYKFRSSHPDCFVKKMFLEISQNSQENTCVRVSFLLKKRPWHRCFPLNFAKFLRTPFLQSTSGGCFCKFLNKILYNLKNQLKENVETSILSQW